jgi:hypothetical protein
LEFLYAEIWRTLVKEETNVDQDNKAFAMKRDETRQRQQFVCGGVEKEVFTKEG